MAEYFTFSGNFLPFEFTRLRKTNSRFTVDIGLLNAGDLDEKK
jgi:hypothetical protein